MTFVDLAYSQEIILPRQIKNAVYNTRISEPLYPMVPTLDHIQVVWSWRTGQW